MIRYGFGRCPFLAHMTINTKSLFVLGVRGGLNYFLVKAGVKLLPV